MACFRISRGWRGSWRKPGSLPWRAEFAYASDRPSWTRLRRLLRNASHVLAAHPEQLPCQLLARWPRAQPGDNADSSALPLEQTLRAQAQRRSNRLAAGPPGRQPVGIGGLAAHPYRPWKHGERPGGAPRRAARFRLRGSHHQAVGSGQRRCAATLEGHSDSVNALAVLPDGRLASGSRDHTIKLWDPASGSCAATLEGHSAR